MIAAADVCDCRCHHADVADLFSGAISADELCHAERRQRIATRIFVSATSPLEALIACSVCRDLHDPRGLP